MEIIKARIWMPVRDYLKRNIGILIGLAVMMMICTFMSENFLTVSNLLNVFRQISTNCFIAFGMTFVILSGGIDISVGSVLAFSGTFAAYSMANWNWSMYAAIIVSLAICIFYGFFNGVVISMTGIAPFVVTLSTQTIIRGIANLIGNGCPIRINNPAFCKIGTGYIGNVSYAIIYVLIVMLICFLALNKTKFGRKVYAFGGNKTAAKYAGIRIERIEVAVYVISSFLSGLAGIILAARLSAGTPTTGEGYECDAIAAVVLGGTSFSGGVGTIGGTLIGAFVIGIINNGLNMLNVSAFWQYVVKGAVILAAVMIDVIRKKNGERRKTAATAGKTEKA
ncbi:MAG: ABC transporter permease [Candidatus Choladocola sp.]|nr:ABC transporter permease [Candidatus Choladocola sp.]